MLALALAAVLSAPPPPLPEHVEAAATRLLVRATGAEPPIDEVQRAAARTAAAPWSGEGSWRSRARLAALVPRVSAELRADDRRYRTIGLTGASEVDYTRAAPGVSAELRLSWDFPHLVFTDSELRAASEARAAAKARAEAVERATRLYYERQRLRVAVLVVDGGGSPRNRAEQELRLEELAAELDAITGGLYSGRAW
jgi:hypothetical protein